MSSTASQIARLVFNSIKNAIRVIPGADYFTEVAGGNISGEEIIYISGKNSDIDSGQTEDITGLGGFYPWQSTASVYNIVSTSANDTSGGTGIRTIIINMLNSNYDIISSETVTLNGTTPVQTIGEGLRVNGVFAVTAGSLESAAGTITITSDSESSKTVANIAPGETRYFGSNYSVPNLKNMFIKSSTFGVGRISGAGIKEGLMFFMLRPINSVFLSEAPNPIRSDGGSPGGNNLSIPFKVSPKTDVIMRASSSSNNAIFSGNYSFILKDV